MTFLRATSRFAFRRSVFSNTRRTYSAESAPDFMTKAPSTAYQSSIPSASYPLIGVTVVLFCISQFQIKSTQQHVRDGHHGVYAH